MSIMTDDDTRALIDRLKLLPELMELQNQTQVAALIGVGYKNWNHTLRTGLLSYNTAKAIVRAVPGLDLDWLTWGVEDGLATHVQRRLVALKHQAQLPNNLRPAARRRPKSP
jgi:hypothetical protein